MRTTLSRYSSVLSGSLNTISRQWKVMANNTVNNNNTVKH